MLYFKDPYLSFQPWFKKKNTITRAEVADVVQELVQGSWGGCESLPRSPWIDISDFFSCFNLQTIYKMYEDGHLQKTWVKGG